MEKLTVADIKILEKRVSSGGIAYRTFLGVSFVLIVLLALSIFLNWEFPASFFIGAFAGFLVVITLILYFTHRKVVLDLANGVRTTLDGVITKMEVKEGYNTYNTSHSKESLEELARYLENKEKGIVPNDITHWNLSLVANYSYLVTLSDGSIHGVTLRNFIDLNIHDKVRITLTPLSKTFLGVSKLAAN